jgi:hypothetical protein
MERPYLHLVSTVSALRQFAPIRARRQTIQPHRRPYSATALTVDQAVTVTQALTLYIKLD